jgi:iron complex transport system substrate-binding protein
MRAGWLVACLLLLGCGQKITPPPAVSPDGNGSKPSDSVSAGSESSPVSQREGGATVFPAVPARRIVSLTPGLTELIYAVGAEQSLVATVEYADYPDAAKQISRIGDAFRVDMEKLLALKPDLVLVWTSGTPATTVEQIKSLGLRVESIEVQHLSEVEAALIRIGELTGHLAQAHQTAQAFAQGVQALRAQYAQRPSLRVFIEVNRQPLYTVNGRHVISEVLDLCGGRNVFADLNQLAPVVGVEAVLNTNPDVILSTDGTVQQVRQDWHVWSQVVAIKQSHIYVVSPDTTTRATPRLLQGAQAVCDALEQAR